MPEIAVSLSGGDINIKLTQEALDVLQETAKKRGGSLEEMIIEALRLEQLLADGSLLMRTQAGEAQELLAV